MSTGKIQPSKEGIEKTIAMIGDEHLLCIINTIRDKEFRFNELQRITEKGINPTTLSNRLKRLESYGLIYRKEETLDKISVVYGLTEKGKLLLPVIEEIAKFSKKFS